jgi:hypothetical protein
MEVEFPNVRPLLSHYTSLSNLENIIANDEVWLSNPLFMNDLEEVRFGVNVGSELVKSNSDLRNSLETDERRAIFYSSFNSSYNEYGTEHVLDLYVMCFSHHNEATDADGRLSMWRGYGSNGNGAAIVFDTSKLGGVLDGPLALAAVNYGTQSERREQIQKKIQEVAGFIQENEISDDRVGNIAHALFQRICLYAVFSKHSGFLEENEWRLVYFKDRDTNNLLKPYFSYFNGPNGIQPKLKLPTRPISGAIDDGFTLSSIVHSIIIGPSSSSLLSKRAVERMLEKLGKPELQGRIRMSEIPFRG